MFIFTFTKINATLQFPLTTSKAAEKLVFLVHALFGTYCDCRDDCLQNVVSRRDVYIVDLCLTASAKTAFIPVRSRNDSEEG